MAVEDPPELKIEFLPWYVVNNSMMRCEGEHGCGALVMSDDAERHLAWHAAVVGSFREVASGFKDINLWAERVATAFRRRSW